MTQSRRPSPLQRRVLIVLAALDEKRPGPVLTRDLERVLERSGEAPVYGPCTGCRRLEGRLASYPARPESAAGCRADRTPARAVAQPLLLAEQDRLRAERRAARSRRAAAGPAAGLPADGTSATLICVGGAERHDVSGLPWGFCGTSLDGGTCLQLWE